MLISFLWDILQDVLNSPLDFVLYGLYMCVHVYVVYVSACVVWCMCSHMHMFVGFRDRHFPRLLSTLSLDNEPRVHQLSRLTDCSSGLLMFPPPHYVAGICEYSSVCLCGAGVLAWIFRLAW